MFIGVFVGTHYSRAWTIHSTLSEARERLQMSRFIWERNITFPDEIKEYFAEGKYDAWNVVEMFSPLSTQHGSYKEKTRSGELGKNATVLVNVSWSHVSKNKWLIVQENDKEKLAFVRYSFLPFCVPWSPRGDVLFKVKIFIPWEVRLTYETANHQLRC